MSCLPQQPFPRSLSSAEFRGRRPSTTASRVPFDGPNEGTREGRSKSRENVEFPAEKSRFSPPHSSSAGIISSPSNPFIKHCVKLRQSSSYRRSCGRAIVVGITPIREIASRDYYHQKRNGLNDDGSPLIDQLLLLDEPDDVSLNSVEFLREVGCDFCRGGSFKGNQVMRVSSAVMKKLSGLQSTDSIDAVAVMKIPHSFSDLSGTSCELVDFDSSFSSPPRRILVLDGIQDPGNVGTLMRTALAFKWDGVFLLPGCCDPFNEKALRAARGASFHLPIISGDWVHVEALKSQFRMKMLAAHPEDMNGNARRKTSLSLSRKFVDSLGGSPLCLVLGSEGQGLSQEAMDGSDLVNIPMAGGFESLNVSVAGGIFMFTLQHDKPLILNVFP